MKKTLSIIFTLCLIFALVGCNNVANKEDYISETIIVTETKKAQANEPTLGEGKLIDNLTVEDKVVKAEIEKYSDTTIDFRNNKQEKIGEKTYNLSFEKVDSMSNFENITYKNELDDEFRYDIDTGKLYYANIESVITEKNDNSIDIKSAQKVAYEYASSNCNISQYVLDLSKETVNGYHFSYSRYIGNYQTTDTFEITVSFGGEISYIINNTNVFNGIDISNIEIDENWINTKINETLAAYNNSVLQTDTIRIDVENQVVILRFSISHNNSIRICKFPIT